jgi:hypothetical protein
MNIEDLPKVIKEIEGLVNVRCGGCLRIIIAKESSGYWIAPFEHDCWDEWRDIEVDVREVRGSVGTLVTVVPVDREERKKLKLSIYRDEEEKGGEIDGYEGDRL